MKKSRHLLLVVLLLIVITGGVYATWTYGTKNAAQQEIKDNTIGIEGATESERGTISVAPGTFTITFDDVNFDHILNKNTDEVKVAGSGVKVTFTVANGSTVNKELDNYHLNYQLSSTLTNSDEGNVITGTKSDLALAKESDGVYSTTLTSTMIFTSIASVDLTLASKEDYDAFAQKLAEATFTVTITDDASSNQLI